MSDEHWLTWLAFLVTRNILRIWVYTLVSITYCKETHFSSTLSSQSTYKYNDYMHYSVLCYFLTSTGKKGPQKDNCIRILSIILASTVRLTAKKIFIKYSSIKQSNGLIATEAKQWTPAD